MPLKITLEHLWLAAPIFVIFAKALRVPLPLLDFWWHLKMGQIIVSTHSIPHIDLFSFTAAGKPFIVQNWLAEIIYYGVFQLGGLPLLIFLNAALLAMVLLPVVFLCRESTARTIVAALSALLACLALAANARPQVFSFVMFAFFYWILDGYRFRHRDKLWLLPLAMVFWVNLHGAFVVGLGLTLIFLGSESIRHLTNSGEEDILSLRQLKKLGLILAACMAATLLNPQTYKIYDYILVVISDRASQQLAMEWQPAQVSTFLGIQMFYGLFGLAILGFIYSHRRRNLTDLALLLGFSIFGLTALRNTAWFAVVAAPILARYWAELDFREIFGAPVLPRLDVPAKPSAQQHNGLNFALFGIALLILVLLSPWIRPALCQASLLEVQTPVKAIDYIEQHNLQGHIFHPQIFGDYLIWRLYPQQQSFIDGRVHLFGESFVHEYRNVFCDSHWEKKLEFWNIQLLLLSKENEQSDSRLLSKRARASKNWQILFEDEVSSLWGRKR